MSGDTLSILRHPTSALCKTWKADGTIAGYGDAKYFTLETKQVESLAQLHELLLALAGQPNAVLIRGVAVDAMLAKERDGEQYKPGKVRRSLDYFDDQPGHWVLIDVDRYDSLTVDAILDPQGAIDDFIQTSLPAEFAEAGYIYQLSNSHGHPGKAGTLNAHIWFWLAVALTSAQLKAYALDVSLAADMALFHPVQCHYTANPIFEDGVVDPVARSGAARIGYVQGLVGDELELRVSLEAMAAGVTAGSGGRAQRMRDKVSADPIVQALEAKGLVKSARKDGGLNIVCPFADEHTGESAETSTQYFPPHTGGFEHGNFKCLHAHCAGRGRLQFLARLGVSEIESDKFDAVEDDADSSAPDTRKKPKPERMLTKAQHLCTDLSNANRIHAHYGKRMIVIAGDWYTWTGTHWQKDESDVYRNFSFLSKIIKAEAADWLARPSKTLEEKQEHEAVAKALNSWSTASESKARIDAGIWLLKKQINVSADCVNKDPYLVNCKNGTVDIRTGAMHAHDPADRITRCIPIDYKPDAKCDVWKEALAQITMEPDLGESKPLADFLQRWFGYCATGSVREHKFVVHYGQGSNGKSTVLETVSRVLGSYASTAAPGLMLAGGSDRHPTEIAALFGQRMVTAHESGEGATLREDFVKQATGGDTLVARFMRGDFFEYRPTHKLQLLTNYKPAIKGQDHGIWRRILLVPYQACFGSPEAVKAGMATYKKDSELMAKLDAESEGILAWLLSGAKDWFINGLQEPDVVRAASNDYQSEQDRVRQFVTEMCMCEDGAEIALTGTFGLFEAYRTWCKDAGFSPLARLRFVGELLRVAVKVKIVDKRVGQYGDANRKQIKTCVGIRLLDAA